MTLVDVPRYYSIPEYAARITLKPGERDRVERRLRDAFNRRGIRTRHGKGEVAFTDRDIQISMSVIDYDVD